MRSIKELLQVLLDNQQHFSTGLCHWVYRLEEANIISIQEQWDLMDYIRKHRPSKFSSFTAFKQRNSNWYWPKRTIEPRLKWINKHIKKLNNENH